MVVVAIIGLLAALAVPQYQNYVKRVRIAEGLSMASAAKVAVAEAYAVGITTAYPGQGMGNAGGDGYKFPGETENIRTITVADSGEIMIVTKVTTPTGNLIWLQLTPVDGGIGVALNDPASPPWSGTWQCSLYGDMIENGQKPSALSMVPSECRRFTSIL